MPDIRPFELHVPDETLKDIEARVRAFPWHEMPEDGGWAYGANLDYMKELCAYWLDGFDWRTQEAAINRHAHFVAPVDGIDIHFMHEKGSGPDPMPLILSHGWPGSVVEFLDFVEPLAHPERFGGKVEDAFDVVAPSLIGFGFSGKPPRPFGPRKMAGYFNKLMTEVLGYERYMAQGGDWGGALSSWLGFDHAPACRGIHVNILIMRTADGPQGPDEEAWAAAFEREQEMENGYRTQQATKPQTLSYAMMDSPVGIAAWLIEKFNSWSDTVG
ncbi:MAG: epoxide hydrolase, partial [Rickettsiales bacterium]